MPPTPARTILTVSELNGSVRLLLSSHFGVIWVEGEISNLSQPSSGHLYFTLKDADAQVRCALFKGPARGLGFRPANGMKVLARANVSLYEPRGDYQLVVDFMEEAGDGALRRAFEVLKAKLSSEGLFDPARKQAIPALPNCLGVITSPTGAAVRDILHVLQRRFPALPVIIFPVKVQGNEAKFEIVKALQAAEKSGLVDTLILARGGGSLEDLWAFNEEIVARAMAACSIPIVTGIGHETDFTIADWVADLRAPTPSAAAETVSPDSQAWLASFIQWENRLIAQMRRLLADQSQKALFLEKRLLQAHPQRQLQIHAQKLDELELRLNHALIQDLSKRESQLQNLQGRLYQHHPAIALRLLTARHSELDRRLRLAVSRLLEQQRTALETAGAQLHAVSPLATLERGYAIASRSKNGKILRSIDEIQAGEDLQVRLVDGVIETKVQDKHRAP